MMEDAVGQIAVAALRRFLPPVGVVNRYATGGAIMAILVVTAYIAGVVAAWFALSDVYGPAIASLVVALSCLVLALVTWGVTALLNRMARERRAREARLRAAAAPSAEAELVDIALKALPGLVKEKPIMTLLCVAGAVFMATRSK